MKLERGAVFLAKHELLDELGSGGFGTVWRAVNRTTHAEVAIKFLTNSSGRTDRRRFMVEARVLERLDHPNAVKVLEHGVSADDVFFMVMELVSGGTLSHWLQNREFTESEVLDIASQIAGALGAAHRNGIVHRDLKPANVLISTGSDGLRVTVLDFGIAKVLGVEQTDITKSGEVLGTPGYMSPEQLLGQRNIGPATDVYGLGLLLFAMLERRPAFGGATPLEIGMAHLTQPAPAVQRGPQELRQLIDSMLRKEAGQRPPLAVVQTTIDRLRGIKVEQPVEDHTETGRWRAAVLLAALILATLVGWQLSRPTPAPRAPQTRTIVTAPVDEPTKPPSVEAVDVDGFDDASNVGCVGLRSVQPGESNIVRADVLDTGHRLKHYVPTHYSPGRPIPLVFVLHETEQSVAEVIEQLDLRELADRHTFFIAWPEGAKELFGGDYPWKHGVDIVSTSLAKLSGAYCIDQRRIYMVGHGSGGSVAEQLGETGLLAAIATSSFRFYKTGERRLEPQTGSVPRIDISGRKDGWDQPPGGKGPCVPNRPDRPDRRSWSEQREALGKIHGCKGPAAPWEPAPLCERWRCTTPLVTCLHDGGRVWNRPRKECEGPPPEFGVAEAVWAFFDEHKLATDDD